MGKSESNGRIAPNSMHEIIHRLYQPIRTHLRLRKLWAHAAKDILKRQRMTYPAGIPQTPGVFIGKTTHAITHGNITSTARGELHAVVYGPRLWLTFESSLGSGKIAIGEQQLMNMLRQVAVSGWPLEFGK